MTSNWIATPLGRQLLFLGANLAITAVLAFLFILPLIAFYETREAEIAKQTEVLVRLKAVADRNQAVQDTVQQRSKDTRIAEFLAGANDGVANANLQARLKAASESSGARVRSVQGLPSKSVGQLRYIGVRIEISGTLPAVHRTIHAIESARPYLLVAGGAIRASREIDPRGITEPVLEAHFEVVGVLQTGGRD